eukprot:8628089-Ditylum_brightwellii.AAC.1
MSTTTARARAGQWGSTMHLSLSQHSNPELGYCFVNNSTIVQLAPTPDTPTKVLVQMAQEEIDLYAGLARSTGGQ